MTQSSSRRFRGLGGPLVLLGLVTAFYWKALSGDYAFVFVDSSRFFYPFWKWGAAVLRSGLLPLWNPDAQFGTPYFADSQMAYAYPPLLLLYACLNPTLAFDWVVILHHLWALAGFWVFARSKGLAPVPALFGSLVFGFSLHVVCSSWTPVALMTLSWIPWIFWAVERLAEGRKGGFVFLSFSWAMQLAAGYPVLCYLTGLAVALRLLFKFIPFPLRDWKEKTAWVPRLAGSVLVGGLYNLAWGLPFLEFFRLSNFRNGEGRYQALSGLDWGTGLSPFLQGHPLLDGYHGPHYWISTYFMGLPPLVLILWALARGKLEKKLVLPWLLILALSAGETLWLGGWLKTVLPGYSLVIRSGFWLSLLVFWTAWLAGLAAQALLSGPGRTADLFGGLGAAALVYGSSFFLQRPMFGTEFGLSLLFTALLFLAGSRGAWVRGLLLAAGLYFSLGPAARSVNIQLQSFYYDQPARLLSVMPDRGRIFFAPSLMEEARHLKGDDMVQAYDTAKQRLLPNWPLTYSREEAQMYNTFLLPGPGLWAAQALKYSVTHSREVLNYLDVRYVFGNCTFKDLKPLSPMPVPVAENPKAYPKWFSVGRALPASTLEGDFARAAREKISYKGVCFIAEAGKAGDYAPRKVSETARTPQRLELSAVGGGRALLVSSETQYPGWKATVDGKERPVETVNHVFRGVALNDGEERVVLSYEPAAFRLGLFVSLLVCGLWGGLLFQRAVGAGA